jgi:hypothetical protein
MQRKSASFSDIPFLMSPAFNTGKNTLSCWCGSIDNSLTVAHRKTIIVDERGGCETGHYQKSADRSRRIACYNEPMTVQRCNQCGQKLIEIDNHGDRLVGCLTCNLWAAADSARWIRLGEEDLRALHRLRHRGSR